MEGQTGNEAPTVPTIEIYYEVNFCVGLSFHMCCDVFWTRMPGRACQVFQLPCSLQNLLLYSTTVPIIGNIPWHSLKPQDCVHTHVQNPHTVLQSILH
jgi:hypothetical protein